MRINQYISHNTKYSRREADELISSGRVNIEKKKAILSDKIDGERVFIDGKMIKKKDENIYTVIVYNKPKGELVTKSDDRGRRTIYDSLSSGFSHFIPIGRLDFASEGLLPLSDFPKVAKALMDSKLERIYNIKIDGSVSRDTIAAMESGVELDCAVGGHNDSVIERMSCSPFMGYERS